MSENTEYLTEEDAELVEEWARVYESEHLAAVAARIRRAIGEPVRYIGQPQADAIIQEMIDDGTYTPSAEELHNSGGAGE